MLGRITRKEGRGAVMDFQRRRLNATTHLGERVYITISPTFKPPLFRGRRGRSKQRYSGQTASAAGGATCGGRSAPIPLLLRRRLKFRHNTQYCELFTRGSTATELSTLLKLTIPQRRYQLFMDVCDNSVKSVFLLQ